jgi:hypothetical protein
LEQSSPRAVGTLSIQTTPAEATVIVDGEVRGTTPIDLPKLAVGPHRVVIRRAGFLENSADVEVTAGRTTTLDRALTPEPRTGTGRASPPAQNAPAPPPRSSPPPKTSSPPQSAPRAGGGGGGAGKWIAIAGGAAAAAAVGASKAGSKATQNAPPNAGTITISPTGTGMAGQTSFSFRSAGASDPDQDSLTYSWTFGDNATGTGDNVTHTYTSAGTFSIGLTVTDSHQHSVTAPSTTVTVGPNLTGTWTDGTTAFIVGTVTGEVVCPTTLTLSQNGTSITGSMSSQTCFGTVPLLPGSINVLSHPTRLTIATGQFAFRSIQWALSFSMLTNAAGTTMNGEATVTRTFTPAGGFSISFRKQ